MQKPRKLVKLWVPSGRRTGSPSPVGGAQTPATMTIEGIDEKTVGLLVGAGLDSVEKVSAATPEELVAIKGIGKKTVEKIVEALGGGEEQGAGAADQEGTQVPESTATGAASGAEEGGNPDSDEGEA